MEAAEKKDNKVIPFIIGLLFGWKGVQITTHLIYIGIITGLVVVFLLKP